MNWYKFSSDTDNTPKPSKVFTGITQESLNWWANYAVNHIFSSPQEAKDWIFNKREFADRQSHAPVFGIDGPEYNRAFADAMPIYQSGKSWKIGKRIRTDNRFRLNNLEVKRPSSEELNIIAQSNGSGEYKIHPVKWIKVSFSDDDYYMTSQKERIDNLANQIKTNNWIEAIVYDYASQTIIEGQHRARAIVKLGFNTVPGIGIEYLDDGYFSPF